MIIDTHTHVWSFPSYRDLSQHIKTTEDLIAFRTRYPDLYKCCLTEPPIDNSDELIADMDRNGVALTLVQARPGYTTNDQVAQSVARHPDRMIGLMRVGHDQEAAGYHDDPGPTREGAPGEVERCLTKLKMKGVGEIFIRSLTSESASPCDVAAISSRLDCAPGDSRWQESRRELRDHVGRDEPLPPSVSGQGSTHRRQL